MSLITTESKRLSERFRFLQFRYSDSEAASELIKYEDTQDGLSLKYEAGVKRLSPSLWENVCLPGRAWLYSHAVSGARPTLAAEASFFRVATQTLHPVRKNLTSFRAKRGIPLCPTSLRFESCGRLERRDFHAHGLAFPFAALR